jgi:hypothetical protein
LQYPAIVLLQHLHLGRIAQAAVQIGPVQLLRQSRCQFQVVEQQGWLLR